MNPRLVIAAVFLTLWPLAAQQTSVRLTRVVSGLRFPTDIQHTADGTNRLFVTEQQGRIRILRNGALFPEPFLDISSRTIGEGESGLLGLAFPPDYARKQYFYVNYTDLNGDTIIARYRLTPVPDRADADSETILLKIPQPYSNHNGGQIRFGPDGYLYIGMGDGGGGGDQLGHAQNKQSLLGKMLRVDTESDLTRLRVPPDNPFVNDTAWHPFIWALGLRNPWRFTFDRANRDMWIGDVGQDRAEEVSRQPGSSRGGENYGWNRMEGLQCFEGECSRAGLTLPVLEYDRTDGCCVIGGYVYRGSRSPGLRGTYLYGDHCSGRIWGLRRDGDEWVNRRLLDAGFFISTFGEDEAGEVYVADHGRGEIHRISGPVEPAFSEAAVVNAASFEKGIVAGSLATIFVAGVMDNEGIVPAESAPLPASLNGVSVLVNSRRAPLLALASREGREQINLQAPLDVVAGATASVIVMRATLSSAPVEVTVQSAQPGIFATADGEAIVVHHADNALVTRERPLDRGEIFYFYATGLGSVENQPAPGIATPRSPLAPTLVVPQATLGGAQCEVLYAGLAPDLVGVYQINARAPRELPAGTHDLLLSISGARSRAAKVHVK